MKKLLIAGASGYLGSCLCAAAMHHGFETRVLVRNEEALRKIPVEPDEVHIGAATEAPQLQGLCRDIDCVISALGITRQKDGMTYEEVDYQANRNILGEALRSGVPRFAYVSVFNGERLRKSKLVDAKERFVEELKAAAIMETIIRPTGFFSDMGDFLSMAKRGRVYMFGDGKNKMNPIDGNDLAAEILHAVRDGQRSLDIGGPQTFELDEIAKLALECASSNGKIIHLPDGLRRFLLWILPKTTPLSLYGPLQFFLTALAEDAAAPQYGRRTLRDFFLSEMRARTAPETP